MTLISTPVSAILRFVVTGMPLIYLSFYLVGVEVLSAAKLAIFYYIYFYLMHVYLCQIKLHLDCK